MLVLPRAECSLITIIVLCGRRGPWMLVDENLYLTNALTYSVCIVHVFRTPTRKTMKQRYIFIMLDVQGIKESGLSKDKSRVRSSLD